MVMFGIAVMLLVRSFVEVDVIHPYVVGSFLLYYAAGLLARPQNLENRSFSVAPLTPRWRHAT